MRFLDLPDELIERCLEAVHDPPAFVHDVRSLYLEARQHAQTISRCMRVSSRMATLARLMLHRYLPVSNEKAQRVTEAIGAAERADMRWLCIGVDSSNEPDYKPKTLDRLRPIIQVATHATLLAVAIERPRMNVRLLGPLPPRLVHLAIPISLLPGLKPNIKASALQRIDLDARDWGTETVLAVFQHADTFPASLRSIGVHGLIFTSYLHYSGAPVKWPVAPLRLSISCNARLARSSPTQFSRLQDRRSAYQSIARALKFIDVVISSLEVWIEPGDEEQRKESDCDELKALCDQRKIRLELT